MIKPKSYQANIHQVFKNSRGTQHLLQSTEYVGKVKNVYNSNENSKTWPEAI